MDDVISLPYASHILFRVFNRIDTVNGGTGNYMNILNDLKRYIESAPVGPRSQRPKLDIKVTTLVGNSDPTNQTGVAAGILNKYFAGMSTLQRQAFFRENFPGTQDEYNQFLANMRRIDDSLRLRLTINDTFIIISLTNTNNNSSLRDNLYHITLGLNPQYNVAGQHGVPNISPVTSSVHLTDETENIHYFFTTRKQPLNEHAASLLSTLRNSQTAGRRRKTRRRMNKTRRIRRGGSTSVW